MTGTCPEPGVGGWALAVWQESVPDLSPKQASSFRRRVPWMRCFKFNLFADNWAIALACAIAQK